jgi:UDP-glucuronate decarboxylase
MSEDRLREEALAEEVIELTGWSSKLLFHPLPVDDPMQRQPDISFAWQKMGWETKVQLKEGLRHTIAYFDELLSGAQ